MNILWFLPIHGDGRYLGTSLGGRAVDYGYLRQIAQAADELGYSGVLIPTGRSCEDPWVVGSSLVGATRRLRFLVALRPGALSPTAAARMTATLDRLSSDRLDLNVVVGGDPAELAGDGLFLDHDARYDHAGDFIAVWKRLLAGEEVNLNGQHIRVAGARQIFLAVQRPHPPLYFGGSSAAALRAAARDHDVYLSWGEPPAQVGEKPEEVRRQAAALGRMLRYGLRLHVIVRSEGQRRMSALHGGSRGALEISPNLWAGVGLVRGGAGTALVGDPGTVAERLREYQALGIDSFILSGYPHLEEAYRFAELVFPLLPVARDGGSLVPAAGSTSSFGGPFGEVVADAIVPYRRPSAS